MLPIDFEGTNTVFNKPADMTDEQCSSIRAFVGNNVENTPVILTAWQPNKEDIEAINAGRPVMLLVTGKSLPPVLLYTYDENYETN